MEDFSKLFDGETDAFITAYHDKFGGNMQGFEKFKELITRTDSGNALKDTLTILYNMGTIQASYSAMKQLFDESAYAKSNESLMEINCKRRNILYHALRDCNRIKAHAKALIDTIEMGVYPNLEDSMVRLDIEKEILDQKTMKLNDDFMGSAAFDIPDAKVQEVKKQRIGGDDTPPQLQETPPADKDAGSKEEDDKYTVFGKEFTKPRTAKHLILVFDDTEANQAIIREKCKGNYAANGTGRRPTYNFVLYDTVSKSPVVWRSNGMEGFWVSNKINQWELDAHKYTYCPNLLSEYYMDVATMEEWA